jgi:hypothetical protein
MAQEDHFSIFLERYSEFLADSSNKDDLLQLGRRLFGASSTTADNRQSLQLLREKEAELSGTADRPDTKSKTTRTARSLRSRLELSPPLTQEQIIAEINQLHQKNVALYADRSSREEQRQRMAQEYDGMIQTSVDRKAQLKAEVHSLSLELSDSLMRPRPPSPAPQDVSGIRAIMCELSDLNGQVLQKIGSFREATRDALAHCERAALDRYKPKMEELLERIYEIAVDLSIDEIGERFDDTSDEIELQIHQLQVELTTENGRNERLQTDTQRLEDSHDPKARLPQ